MRPRIYFSLPVVLSTWAFLFSAATADTLDNAAVRRFQSQTSSAMQGKAEEQFRLGEMYEKGEGTHSDLAMAYLWYNRAASQGHAVAKEKIANMDKNKAGVSEEQARVDAAMRALQQQSDRDRPKPAAKPAEAAKPQPAPQPATRPVAKAPEAVAPAPTTAPVKPASTDAVAAPEKGKPADGGFSSNPCKGPQAKFLSTCN